jgi:hypothetical protein
MTGRSQYTTVVFGNNRQKPARGPMDSTITGIDF